MWNNSNFFSMLSRMKYVNRWGLMRNTIHESLSDHTMDVIMIAHALAIISNTYFEGRVDAERTALLAAFHDAPEIITGDMPTPVKYYDETIKNAYCKVEEAAIDKMLSSLPDELKEEYSKLMKADDEDDKQLIKFVKAADKLSALIKCIEEERMGNHDFDSAKESTQKIISSLNMPEAEFFIKHFLPGYYLTLDDQTRQ